MGRFISHHELKRYAIKRGFGEDICEPVGLELPE